jgi:hypothetical protein
MDFSERLNFSDKKENVAAVKIPKWSSVNYYETLCLYCAENGIDLSAVDDSDFEGCSELMAMHGQSDKSTDHYYFWIDNQAKATKMTLYEFGRMAESAGFPDLFDFCVDGDILNIKNMTGSLADITGDRVLEFKIIKMHTDELEIIIEFNGDMQTS